MVPLAELRDIVKTFPGVRANDGVTFTIRAGEVHGLLGENGAGKSTLMSILYGLYQPDSGDILRKGARCTIASPRQALAAGIAIVQQHFALVPTLSVADNVILGQEPSRILRRGRLTRTVQELSDRYRLELDPAATVGALSIGQRQRVEILKCLFREPEVVVFDEPTTVLTPQEIRDLFDVISALRNEERGIVLITHKLDELLHITDRITVLRHGRSEGTLVTAETDGPALARLMVGRDVKLRTTATFVGLTTGDDPEPSGIASSAKDMVRTARSTDPAVRAALELSEIAMRVGGVDRLRGVTLRVGAGEIVGVAGVEGNGQRELVALLCGTSRSTSGSVIVDGTDMTAAGPVELGRAGVRVVTEDRHTTGCVLDMTVGENLLTDRIGESPFSRYGVIAKGVADRVAGELIQSYRIKTPGPHVLIRALSGGNQQRAILARELSRPVRVLVAAQPTRGLDVGAIEEVTERVISARDSGAGVLLISSDLAEILALSDRIAVLYRGSIIAVLRREEAGLARLGELMAGLDTVPVGVTPS